MNPRYSGGSLLAHYASPISTRGNTVLMSVKVGTDDTFQVEAHDATNGAKKWTLQSDYSLPPHGSVPSFGIALTPKDRLYLPGAGGTIYFRDAPDSVVGATGQVAFYGMAQYQADPLVFDANVKISTPITVDRYGNIYFGFLVLGPNPANLLSGLARIGEDGVGTWISAASAAADSEIQQVPLNCAPALSNDHKKLYVAVAFSGYGGGYLVALDSRTLAPLAKVRLRDPLQRDADVRIPDDVSASPTVGPDGDIYFGVSEAVPYSNRFRGWLLHFDSSLAQTKLPGSFGWDDTASIVSSSLIPSYSGPSTYFVLTKYNDYVWAGGDGANKLGISDPNEAAASSINGVSVMKAVLTITNPTPDPTYPNIPTAVTAWCTNNAAVDPATKSVFAGAEDGKLYRWHLPTNSLSEAVTLTSGVGEAYTPTVIGVDGTVYAIANGQLYAVAASEP